MIFKILLVKSYTLINWKPLEFVHYLNSSFSGYKQKINFYFYQCFNSVQTFFNFLLLKVCQKYLNKDRQLQFFPWKAEIQGFLPMFIWIEWNGDKTNIAARLQRHKLKNALSKFSWSLMG